MYYKIMNGQGRIYCVYASSFREACFLAGFVPSDCVCLETYK